MEIYESMEKSPPVCFVLGRWAFFLVIKTIILMTLIVQYYVENLWIVWGNIWIF